MRGECAALRTAKAVFASRRHKPPETAYSPQRLPVKRKCPFRRAFHVPPPVGRGNTDDYLCGWDTSLSKNQLTPTRFSGIIKKTRCSSPGRALGLGPRGTEFESPHFDQQRESWRGLLFCTTSPRTPMDARTFFAPNHAAFSRRKVPRKHRLPGDLFLFEGLLCPAGDARLWAKDFPTYSGTSSFLQPKTRQRSRRQTRPP